MMALATHNVQRERVGEYSVFAVFRQKQTSASFLWIRGHTGLDDGEYQEVFGSPDGQCAFEPHLKYSIS
jgi:hypothetical protein